MLLMQAPVIIVDAGVVPIQRAALVDLCHSTNGPHWKVSTGWLLDDPCANRWTAVQCDATGTNITCVSGCMVWRVAWLDVLEACGGRIVSCVHAP